MRTPSKLLLLLTFAIAFPAYSADFTPVLQHVEDLVKSELEQGILTGVSVALVDDQTTVLAYGFGLADEAEQRPATSRSVYRAGSISKLFTAISAMQLVEQGKLDLDKPVTDYLPDFRMVERFDDAEPVTLRQLMCHRSGLVRESPIGGYLDPNEPSIDESVASLADCVRVHPPAKVTKYSNIGVTIVGQAVAKVSGMPFAEYQRKHVLNPLGMTHSSFLRDEHVRDQLSNSYMLVADGHGGFDHVESPLFDLGTLPAGNLFTSVEDLARFLSCLFADGKVNGEQILKPETLIEMWTPQLTESDSGFGLGFSVGEFRDHKRISHSGAVYGFSSSCIGLPELKVGVVVLANEDIAMGPVSRIANTALGWMVDARLGNDLEPLEAYEDVPKELAQTLVGDYESESYWAELRYDESGLRADLSGQSLTVKQSADGDLVFDGRWKNNSSIELQRDDDGSVTGFNSGGQNYRRVDPNAIPDVPEAWQEFLGSYGPEFIPLVVSIKHGHLYAMTENMVDYRLRPINRTVFKMCPGMYEDEELVFQLSPLGRAHTAVLAGMELPRTSP
jgi:CubicO group peptidase (beta-lactamase class C family)